MIDENQNQIQSTFNASLRVSNRNFQTLNVKVLWSGDESEERREENNKRMKEVKMERKNSKSNEENNEKI